MEIGFVDFSKEERNKVLLTLRLLGTPTALDELGIGVIRDAFADILFPGISTLQTRAKYFVLIPYLFEKAAHQKLSSGRELYRWLVASEDKMVETLVKNSESGETGIIGREALKQNRTVKLKPSSIYWGGLRTFEIVRNPKITLAAACNVAWARRQKKREIKPVTEEDSYDDPTAGHGHAVLFSPLVPDKDFEKNASIVLTRKEAEFLTLKITSALRSKDTLLAFLIKHRLNFDSFHEIEVDLLPSDIKQDYLLAKGFSDFIYGAHLRYNVIFSNYQDENMLERFIDWRTEFIRRDFNLQAILGRISCNYAAAKFCIDFLSTVYQNDFKNMDELIISREIEVKGDRSKLLKPEEYRYDPARPAHYYKLDFRFGTAKTIIADIIKGLEA